MKLVITKDQAWLDKWDAFVSNENTAGHLLLSDWNKSFKSYGFDYEACLCIDEEDVVRGGYVAVIAKATVFKFYLVPLGPIISPGFETQLNDLIVKVQERAKVLKCCYGHISLPYSTKESQHTYSDLNQLQSLKSAQNGHVFKYVYSAYGINWIDLKGHDEESKIATLKPSVRRNIRNSYRKDLVFKTLATETEIESGYALFSENAMAANYSIRDWSAMKDTLLNLNKKGYLKMLAAYKGDELKGAILLLKGGNYYTYILGGSKKEVPDLRTGDFLQWEAIKLSLQEGLDGYNISLGGSKGVVEFKNSFNTEPFYFEEGQWYWIIKPSFFKAYLAIEKHLKKHKKTIAQLLAKVKR